MRNNSKSTAKNTGSTKTKTVKNDPWETSQEKLNEMISKKACEIWQSKGCPSGKDTENWLEAEKLVKSGRR